MKRRPILVVSNVLLDQQGNVLLGLRSKQRKWSTPGGKVEAESVIDGGKREMLEETGVVLTGNPVVIGFTDGWEWAGRHGGNWHVAIQLLWDSWTGKPEVVEDSHLQWKWFPFMKLPKDIILSDGAKIVLSDLLPKYLKIAPTC